MFHTPDWYHNVSLRLSEVLDDIGVNERLVLKERRAHLLLESIHTIGCRLRSYQFPFYHLGSQSEGTTTIGLKSDSDIFTCFNSHCVIQNWDEWSPGKRNLMMICDKSTPPGYCYLQVLRRDATLPETEVKEQGYAKDKHGKVWMKNSATFKEGMQRNGPSRVFKGIPGEVDRDGVISLPFQSWPQSARPWLQQKCSRWPTTEMKQYAATLDCHVVPTGSCVSEHNVFQWRISTCLAERYLMFQLNITQIRCYILLKMILKTFINLNDDHEQQHISSYMCKTVLLHCVERTGSYAWKESNILICLIYCLCTLKKCILCGNCPHFIIPENSLMAGKITAENKPWLLKEMSKLIQNTAGSLLEIQIDKLSQRLKIKLGILHDADYNAIFCVEILQPLNPDVYRLYITNLTLSRKYYEYLIEIKHKSLEKQILQLRQTIAYLAEYHTEGTLFKQKACRVLAPFFWTSLGSLIASYNIQQNNPVCPLALKWLFAGTTSDFLSSRLKLASVFYCTGDMEKAESILKDTEKPYNIDVVLRGIEVQCKIPPVQPVCRCYMHSWLPNQSFVKISHQVNEECFRYITPFCVRFLPSEINCIPKELQYEMFRSTEKEKQHREEADAWMDLAVVDSIPYLYFLQYKTYRNLQRLQDQRQALHNLLIVTTHEQSFGHSETAWNLLGQCMEQENNFNFAVWCYSLSLHVRETNNVARFHICMLLARRIADARENSLGLQNRH